MADNTFTLSIEIQSQEASRELKTLQKELANTSEAAKKVGKGFGEGVKDISAGVSSLTGNLRGLTTGGLAGATEAISGLTSGLGLAAGAFVGLAAAAAAGAAALIANSSALAAAADDAAELADKLGLTTTQLAAFELLASENGTTVQGLVSIYDRLVDSLDKMEKGNTKVGDAFRELGIAQEDIAGKSKEQIAGIVIKNYETLGRTVQATAAVQDILGRSFRDQIPAIKSASEELEEYQKRVEGTVASKALEEAGSRQEKAFSDLGLALKQLRLEFSSFFTETAADAAAWAAKMIKTAVDQTRTIKQSGVSMLERLQIEAEELGKGSPFEAEERAVKRMKELGEKRRSQREVSGLRGRPDGTPISVPPSVPEDNAEQAALDAKRKQLQKEEEERLKREAAAKKAAEDAERRRQELERNRLAFTHASLAAFAEVDKQITNLGLSGDKAAQDVNNLALKLYDAGKGAATYAEALKLAQTQQDKFNQIIELTNNNEFNKTIKELNSDLNQQLDLLGATTEVEKQRLVIRKQLKAIFDDQKNGMTPEQAKTLEEALAQVDIKLESIAKKRIDVAVGNQMKDLTEQSGDLAYEIQHFWDVNREGLVSHRIELEALYRAVDPEGRGKNLTEAQKAQLENQLKVIEEQKKIIQQNQQIEDSFKNLGSAVSDWALGSENGIKRVKIELIKLAALAIWQQAFGVQSGVANSFFSGLMSGLSGSRASGGPILANEVYRVGERGPETIVSTKSAYVIPNQVFEPQRGSVMVTLYPTFNNHGTINSAEDIDQMFNEWGTGIITGVSKTIREQYGAAGLMRA